MKDILIFNIITGSVEGWKTGKYTALKVHRKCPLLLLVKVGWKGGRAMKSEQRACQEDAAEEMS